MANQTKIQQIDGGSFGITAQNIARLEAEEGITLRGLEAANFLCLVTDGEVTGALTNASTPDHLPWTMLETVARYCNPGANLLFDSTGGRVRLIFSPKNNGSVELWEELTNEPKPKTLKDARGNKVTVNFGDKGETTFTAGGRKRFLLDEVSNSSRGIYGFVVVNATLRLADGSEAFALLEIDESSSGEHYGTGVFLPSGGIAWQDDADFATRLGKREEDIFPYRYKFTGPTNTLRNHHIGDDGWSV